MIVAFDTSVLVYLFDEQARAPLDPATGAPVSECKDRLDFLIATLQRGKPKIVIPTPALGELLVKAQQAAPEWLAMLHKSQHFKFAGFDERAAIEFAATQAKRLASGQKSEGASRARAKFDDQIVAIAAVERATVIYSDDPHIKRLAGARFEITGVSDLPLPKRDAQFDLPFDQAEEPQREPEDQ